MSDSNLGAALAARNGTDRSVRVAARLAQMDTLADLALATSVPIGDAYARLRGLNQGPRYECALGGGLVTRTTWYRADPSPPTIGDYIIAAKDRLIRRFTGRI